ncbi:hypothetical protein TNCT_676431, partial [Trichonephila clavata]
SIKGLKLTFVVTFRSQLKGFFAHTGSHLRNYVQNYNFLMPRHCCDRGNCLPST